MAKHDYISIPQLAQILGLSRIAVYKKVKKGEIPATRIGRSYAIAKAHVEELLGTAVSADHKQAIDTAVKKTVREYGDVLKRLGRE